MASLALNKFRSNISSTTKQELEFQGLSLTEIYIETQQGYREIPKSSKLSAKNKS